MTTSSQEELNSSVGSEMQIPCIKCSGRTIHEVVASVDRSGDEPDRHLYWYHKCQIIMCKGCKTLSYREISYTNEDYVQVGEDKWELQASEKLFPSRIEDRKDLGENVFYLPSDLRRIYKETAEALINDLPILAAIGLRAIVETVCKEKNASGNDLNQKINDLALKHILTPSSAEILHKVRSLGNKAAHEVQPHTLKQLSLAMGVVEHLLKDVYILPKLVKEEF